MSFLGSLHVVAAVLALAVAVIVLARTKGTTTHVRLGRVYVVLLILVDSFALLTYQDGIGPFHLLAVLSLATLTAGLAWSPRRRGSRQTHGILMIWSVAGLVGAGLAQGATAALPQATPWPTVATTASVCLLAALATRALASPKYATHREVRQLNAATDEVPFLGNNEAMALEERPGRQTRVGR